MTLYLNYWTLASFCLVIITAPYWPVLPSWPVLIICLSLLTLSIQYRKLRWVWGMALAFGVITVHGNVLRSQTELLFQAGQNITINAQVDSSFKANNFGYQGIVVIRSINGQPLNTFLKPKVRLTSPHKLGLGDKLVAAVSLKPIRGLMNGVGFDAEKYALSVGVVGSATVKKKHSYYVISEHSMRRRLIEQLIPYTEPLRHRGIIEALAFGVRDNIHRPVWDVLQQSGLSHLIAISGLHIGIIFSMGWVWGTLVFRLTPSLSVMPFCLGIAVATAYAWLAGFSLPTVRALIMCSLFCLFQLRWGYLSGSYKWLLTLSVLLFIDPFSSVSASLWLSMAAVAIILFYLSVRTSQASRLKQLLSMQVVIVAAMMPISALLFKGVGVTSLVYNLVFVPWFSFVIIPAVFLALTATLVGIDTSTLWLWIDNLILPVTASLDWASWGWVSLSDIQIRLLCAVFVVVLSLLVMQRQAVVTLVIVSALMSVEWQRQPQWQLVVLDVGHGLSIVIHHRGQTLVYDTGASWATSSVARQYLTPYLYSVGTSSLDYLVLSHLDNDHAGDWQYVSHHWQPKTLLTSQRLDDSIDCLKGSQWAWHDLRIDVLWPPNLSSRAYNPHSCVLKITHVQSNLSVLLAGDIERVAEWMLVRQPQILASDVILVPHHGSNTSSIERFVVAVDAEIAIASTAHGGRWDLPKPEIVERYSRMGAQWYDTGTSGKITLNFYSDSIDLDTLRASKGTSWYRQMLRKGVE